MATQSGNPSMAQRIARALPTLTRSHRQVADYVMAHPLQAATMPIDELAATVGVSVATANRFARALEFDGYPQFRSALVLGFETTLAPVEKLRSKLARSATVSDVVSTTLAGIGRNIESTRQSLDPLACERAVDAILGARRVCVAGFGSSSWLAGLLQRNLDPYCADVQLLATIEGSSHGAKILTRLQPADLLIAIAYPRYLEDTILLAQRARDGGVPVLALTDRVTSPLARLGTVSLYAHADSQYFANSDASVLALIEALCGAVAHRAKGSLKAATQVAESVLPWLHGSHSGRVRPVGESTLGPARFRKAAAARTAK
ncbi:MAG: MurR/RpiR family transcriptional regulator [Ramlibacter sp.]|nr:MurR/RpiR family transcriptional regulator [Ramlibacter sp.]